MKKTFCLVLVVFTNFFSYCQAPDYDDLKILYADGKYEKLVAAADKYTLKESTSKDPNSFMWLARGLYKISISGNSEEIRLTTSLYNKLFSSIIYSKKKIANYSAT